MLGDNIKYTYSDVAVIPSPVFSSVDSRSMCVTRDQKGMLPIFTAPMSSVIGLSNYGSFLSNGIIPIIPRNVSLDERKKIANTGTWVAVSLSEFNDMFVNGYTEGLNAKEFNICVDIANGHMLKLYESCGQAKELAIGNYKLNIMTGNIANPILYKEICQLVTRDEKRVVDFIRCGIGSGNGCITTSNTGIHYPMASLIDGIRRIAVEKYDIPEEYRPKIVADGGIRNYSDVIKALALGADYVMIGGLFSACIESAAEKLVYNMDNKLMECTQKEAEKAFNEGQKVFSRFYGMASENGQKILFGKKKRTSEGITKEIPVEYSIRKWTENMDDYMKSAMSYVGVSNLNNFKNKAITVVISQNSKLAVNK